MARSIRSLFRRTHDKVAAIMVLTVLTLLLLWLWHGVYEARESARRLNSQGRMCAITLSMFEFSQHEAHGKGDWHDWRLPPAFSTDKNGKPLLS
jgi:hypothetical protein